MCRWGLTEHCVCKMSVVFVFWNACSTVSTAVIYFFKILLCFILIFWNIDPRSLDWNSLAINFLKNSLYWVCTGLLRDVNHCRYAGNMGAWIGCRHDNLDDVLGDWTFRVLSWAPWSLYLSRKWRTIRARSLWLENLCFSGLGLASGGTWAWLATSLYVLRLDPP